MRKLLFTAASVSLFVGVPAFATPRYLECTFKGDTSGVSIAADEPAGSVVLTVDELSSVETLPAAFTQNQLQFRNKHYVYTVNRSDLTVVRALPAIDSIENGKCVVQKPRKRAF